MVKHFKRCFETERFSWPEIQSQHGLLHFFVRDELEIKLLGKILSEQTVGVLIGAAFPGGIGMCEIEFKLEQLSDLFMIGKLFAVIGSQRTNFALHGK